MIGRPPKYYERINRLFPECIDKLDDPSLSDKEKEERAAMIDNCLRVCKWFARKQKGEGIEGR